jgi:hypothetical protein
VGIWGIASHGVSFHIPVTCQQALHVIHATDINNVGVVSLSITFDAGVGHILPGPLEGGCLLSRALGDS